ncbi:hypothetical protein GQ457_07G003970 [Hibiscus cannabinus]
MAPSLMQLVMSLMSSTLLSTPDEAPSLIQHAPSPSTTIKPSSSTSMSSTASYGSYDFASFVFTNDKFGIACNVTFYYH